MRFTWFDFVREIHPMPDPPKSWDIVALSRRILGGLQDAVTRAIFRHGFKKGTGVNSRVINDSVDHLVTLVSVEDQHFKLSVEKISDADRRVLIEESPITKYTKRLRGE